MASLCITLIIVRFYHMGVQMWSYIKYVPKHNIVWRVKEDLRFSKMYTSPGLDCEVLLPLHMAPLCHSQAAIKNHGASEAFRGYMGPGVERKYPIEPMKSLSTLLWTLPFVPLLSVSVSESPSPLSLLWLGFQLWMLPLTTSVIPQQPTYPCLPPLMCDLMYCLTVFPPFKINCSFISAKDKTACREHNNVKVVWILFKQNY